MPILPALVETRSNQIREEFDDPAAVPRRPCRQLSPPRAPEDGARTVLRQDPAGRRNCARSRTHASARSCAAQENVGLKGITDGEFRRTYFHVDFLERLDGVETHYGEFVAKFRKDDGSEVGFKPPTMHVEGKIRHAKPIQGADFDFLKSVVTRTPKVCIPAPSMLHFRGGRQAISETAYPDLEQFYVDLTAAYRDEIADLAARGCRYLQLDDTNLAYLCDPKIRESTRARGDDPDALTRLYCRLVNDAIRDRPKDMTISVHLCRGNFKSAWVAQGGYEPVAEILLNEMKIDGFFLEYDDERSGDFAPLRFTPKGKTIVLGLMSSKHSEAEPKDEVKRRIDEASKYVRARPVRAQPPVRLLLDRARQRPHRGRRVAEARALRRGRARSVGRRLKATPLRQAFLPACAEKGRLARREQHSRRSPARSASQRRRRRPTDAGARRSPPRPRRRPPRPPAIDGGRSRRNSR